jgi:hypothetical protein
VPYAFIIFPLFDSKRTLVSFGVAANTVTECNNYPALSFVSVKHLQHALLLLAGWFLFKYSTYLVAVFSIYHELLSLTSYNTASSLYVSYYCTAETRIQTPSGAYPFVHYTFSAPIDHLLSFYCYT